MDQRYINDAPDAVKAAFYHVRAFYPDVTKVTYDQDCRWCYEGEDNYWPDFEPNTVDTGILELGADEQYNISVPVLYVMFPEKILMKCEVPGKPTVVLTQIDVNLWEVNVGSAASTWETFESAQSEFMDSVYEYQLEQKRPK